MSLRSWTPRSRRVRPREAASSAFDLGSHGSVCAHLGHLLLGSPSACSDGSAPQHAGRPDSYNASAEALDHEPDAKPGTDDPDSSHRGTANGRSYDVPGRPTGGHHHVGRPYDNRSPADVDHHPRAHPYMTNFAEPGS
jgi:hypothetical protein